MDGQEASMLRPSRLQSPQDPQDRDRNTSKPGDARMLPMTQALMKQIEAHFGQKVPVSTKLNVRNSAGSSSQSKRGKSTAGSSADGDSGQISRRDREPQVKRKWQGSRSRDNICEQMNEAGLRRESSIGSARAVTNCDEADR